MDINCNYKKFKIGVIGGGSWGTALANLLALKGYSVDQWILEKDVIDDIINFKENTKFLPGINLSENLIPKNKIDEVVLGKDLVLIVTPSHVMREMAEKISSFLSEKTIILSASKGIENVTYLTMTGVLKNVIPGLDDSNLAVITGPSFAREVAKKVPTAVTVASTSRSLRKLIQNFFATDYFRVYTIDDVIGSEIGGAVKNVIAIAVGVIDGLGYGSNTRAALITRGLNEIRKLGIRMGGSSKTFRGLSGIGDLILTSTDSLSRNYSIGKKIGQGEKFGKIVSKTEMVIEGVRTAKSVYNLSKKLNIEMPISHSVYKVLYEGLNLKDAVSNLMQRRLIEEF